MKYISLKYDVQQIADCVFVIYLTKIINLDEPTFKPYKR